MLGTIQIKRTPKCDMFIVKWTCWETTIALNTLHIKNMHIIHYEKELLFPLPCLYGHTAFAGGEWYILHVDDHEQ